MRVVVVTPTYNESKNIALLVSKLLDAFKELDHDSHVLVVDDNSPDGTSEIVRGLMAGHENVHLLTGEKQGLGVAYARGLRYAMDHLKADAVVQMDADFSHDPADVPRLVEALEGHDLVIGSRYVPGGATPPDWGLLRKMTSRCANTAARYIAGLYRVQDCTNGFRCFRTGLLQWVDLDQAYPRGYAILPFLIYQVLRRGGRVREIPVQFTNRVSGDSKLRVADIVEFFANVWWIRYDRRARFFKLATTGLSGIAANLGTLSVLYYGIGLSPALSSALAIEVSILYSFVWNHLWTAIARQPLRASVAIRLARFNLVSMVSFILTFSTFLLTTMVFSWPPLFAQALGVVPALMWNYFVGDRLLGPLWSAASRALGSVHFGAETAGERPK